MKYLISLNLTNIQIRYLTNPDYVTAELYISSIR